MNEIIESGDDIEWKIEELILIGDDVKVIVRLPIIGFSKDTIYHFRLQTDLGTLDYWQTMVSILIERFSIRASPKYTGQKIITYLLVLKKNEYKVLNWEWDSIDDDEILKYIKREIKKQLCVTNTALFEYYQFVKKNMKSEWKGEGTPFKFASKEKEFVNNWVGRFFNHLGTQYNSGKKVEIREITNDENKFCAALTDYIDQLVDGSITLPTDDDFY